MGDVGRWSTRLAREAALGLWTILVLTAGWTAQVTCTKAIFRSFAGTKAHFLRSLRRVVEAHLANPAAALRPPTVEAWKAALAAAKRDAAATLPGG